jgi:hypothetical protein
MIEGIKSDRGRVEPMAQLRVRHFRRQTDQNNNNNNERDWQRAIRRRKVGCVQSG